MPCRPSGQAVAGSCPSRCPRSALQASSLCSSQDTTPSPATESVSWCPRPTRRPLPCVYPISCPVGGCPHGVLPGGWGGVQVLKGPHCVPLKVQVISGAQRQKKDAQEGPPSPTPLNTHMHTYPYKQGHVCTRACTHTHVHRHTRVSTGTMHTCVHKHTASCVRGTRAHACIHRHTHTRMRVGRGTLGVAQGLGPLHSHPPPASGPRKFFRTCKQGTLRFLLLPWTFHGGARPVLMEAPSLELVLGRDRC